MADSVADAVDDSAGDSQVDATGDLQPEVGGDALADAGDAAAPCPTCVGADCPATRPRMSTSRHKDPASRRLQRQGNNGRTPLSRLRLLRFPGWETPTDEKAIQKNGLDLNLVVVNVNGMVDKLPNLIAQGDFPIFGLPTPWALGRPTTAPKMTLIIYDKYGKLFQFLPYAGTVEAWLYRPKRAGTTSKKAWSAAAAVPWLRRWRVLIPLPRLTAPAPFPIGAANAGWPRRSPRSSPSQLRCCTSRLADPQPCRCSPWSAVCSASASVGIGESLAELARTLGSGSWRTLEGTG